MNTPTIQIIVRGQIYSFDRERLMLISRTIENMTGVVRRGLNGPIILEETVPDSEKRYLPIHMNLVRDLIDEYFARNPDANGETGDRVVLLGGGLARTIHEPLPEWADRICARAEVHGPLVDELMARGNYHYAIDEATTVAQIYTVAYAISLAHLLEIPAICEMLQKYVAKRWSKKTPEEIRRLMNQPNDIPREKLTEIEKNNVWILQ